MLQVSIHSHHLSELLQTSKKEMLDIVADALGAAEEEARAKTLVLQQLEASHAYVSHLEALMADESARAGQDIDASASNVLPPASLPTSPLVDSLFLRLPCPSPFAEKVLVGGFLGAQLSWRGPSLPPSPRKVPLQMSRCKYCQALAAQAEATAKMWENQSTNLRQQILTLEIDSATSAAAAAVANELQLQQVLPKSCCAHLRCGELCRSVDTRGHAKAC
jgi:hypothetical protein